ncbi:MAG: glutamate 5-kinase [Myxococcota bacterium]|nr:glutamate 5-kinase [Myxococcales bacterium]
MTARAHRAAARSARRIVVKVGSSTLTSHGAIRPKAFTNLARQVSAIAAQGREVVLVSSGAIAVGSHVLGWSHPGRSIPEKQAAAAVGQIGLVELWQRRFARHERKVAQVLLTRTGLEHRERYLNARRTLLKLLELGVVPIVNENDTVATEEIRFGDNDNLSATIVNLIGADLLVILTDVEGLLERRPTPADPSPPLIATVPEITPAIEAIASGAGSAFGSGGMATKLEAARTAAHSGAATVLCRGGARDALLRVAAGDEIGTIFLAGDGGRRLASRKHWLAFTTRTRGEIVVDAGAAQALTERGRSLLPAGVVAVRGRFQMGDAVSCVDETGRELARGLAAYPSDAVAAIAGRATREIERVLGYSNGGEVIHRDDLVVLDR